MCSESNPDGDKCEMVYVRVESESNMQQLEELQGAECYWIDITKLFAFKLDCDACATATDSVTNLLSGVDNLIVYAIVAGAVLCIVCAFIILWRMYVAQKKRALSLAQPVPVRNAMVCTNFV